MTILSLGRSLSVLPEKIWLEIRQFGKSLGNSWTATFDTLLFGRRTNHYAVLEQFCRSGPGESTVEI
jgi:hypothetical protein